MSREKKKNPCFRSHMLCPRFEHNYFTKLDYVQKTGIGVKQFVLKLSYRIVLLALFIKVALGMLA